MPELAAFIADDHHHEQQEQPDHHHRGGWRQREDVEKAMSGFAALRGPGNIRSGAGRRGWKPVPYILVDEYQDTNQLQQASCWC